jgi:hypothetical protein
MLKSPSTAPSRLIPLLEVIFPASPFFVTPIPLATALPTLPVELLVLELLLLELLLFDVVVFALTDAGRTALVLVPNITDDPFSARLMRVPDIVTTPPGVSVVPWPME